MNLTESIVEEASLEWFGELGYAVGHGARTSPTRRPAWSAAAEAAERRVERGVK